MQVVELCLSAIGDWITMKLQVREEVDDLVGIHSAKELTTNYELSGRAFQLLI